MGRTLLLILTLYVAPSALAIMCGGIDDMPEGAKCCGHVPDTRDANGGFQQRWVGKDSCFACGIKYYAYEQDVYSAAQWDVKARKPKPGMLYRNIGSINGTGYACSGKIDDQSSERRSKGKRGGKGTHKSPSPADTQAVDQ